MSYIQTFRKFFSRIETTCYTMFLVVLGFRLFMNGGIVEKTTVALMAIAAFYVIMRAVATRVMDRMKKTPRQTPLGALR